jgi:hypothetical protein
MFGLPDEMKVYYRGRLVAGTGGEVVNKGTLSFIYRPENQFYTVLVEIASSGTGTSWEYTLECPR